MYESQVNNRNTKLILLLDDEPRVDLTEGLPAKYDGCASVKYGCRKTSKKVARTSEDV